MPTDPLGHALLGIARNAIAERLGGTLREPTPARGLELPAATFVTLTLNGELRGCIGSLQAWRPLAVDVAENAVAAAFRDPRFAPLSAGELASIRIEVSLLETPRKLDFSDQADALAQLRPGIDGVILGHEAQRATFLPQVWESLPDPERFLAQLKLKAGLPADFWDEKITLARYGVQKWKET